jgi:hypothetical protein
VHPAAAVAVNGGSSKRNFRDEFLKRELSDTLLDAPIAVFRLDIWAGRRYTIC